MRVEELPPRWSVTYFRVSDDDGGEPVTVRVGRHGRFACLTCLTCECKHARAAYEFATHGRTAP